MAITGASGSIYGYSLVSWLIDQGHEVHLIPSNAALLVINHELDGMAVQKASDLLSLWPNCGNCLHAYDNNDVGAVLASGSFKYEAMFIIPCSMGTLAAVAHGLAGNLIHRAADVALKEQRRLVIVPRETPLSAVHLENMLKLSRLGVRIVAAMPAFYNKPASMKDMIDFVVGKALEAAGLEQQISAPYQRAVLTRDGNG